MIGDVIGKIGRRTISQILPGLKYDKGIDFCIANAENAAGGFGLTRKISDELFSSQIDVLTSGNHIWSKKEIYQLLEEDRRILRPLNYPSGVPGEGSILLGHGDKTLGVINLCGRIFLETIDCPFRAVRDELVRMQEKTRSILVDIHAEATSEKLAMGYFLDGKVSAVIGTHTHIQTADERILPGGTAYLTDVGMAGPINSIIGIKTDIILKRFLTRLPIRLDVAKGRGQFCGAVIEIDPATGHALGIERIQMEIDVG